MAKNKCRLRNGQRLISHVQQEKDVHRIRSESDGQEIEGVVPGRDGKITVIQNGPNPKLFTKISHFKSYFIEGS